MSDQREDFNKLDEKLDHVIGSMATKDDLHTLEGRMATKDDINELDEKVNRVINVMVTVDEFETFKSEVRSDIADLKETINHLAASMDKLLKVLTDLQVEYAAIKIQMTRYDRWFKELAEKVGLELNP
jgi:iron uptake system EfeUOB component EfeO/EfeM